MKYSTVTKNGAMEEYLRLWEDVPMLSSGEN